MKKLLVFGVLIALILGGIVAIHFKGPSAQEKREFAAMVKVLYADHDAKVKLQPVKKQPWEYNPPPDENRFVRDLKAIDASDCPLNFRLAWLDYVQAWERERQANDRAGMHNLLVLVESMAHPIALLGLNGKPEDDTLKSWQAVVRVALENGITLTEAR